ncbi:MAG: aminotransferase class I/II-fold pyridoxal phosphate-dependent enzyme [Clostridia bacterium]|nr:aminotransferase class I/II-fold pyridoxal phosphate-dependent enzyme [Clostridia bacterium]
MAFDINSTLNKTVVDIPPSGIRRFFDIAATMEDVVSLGVGEPDFVTPWHIREAGILSLEKGHTHYTGNAGLMELRKEICNYMNRRFDLKYDAATQVLVSVGGSEAIDAAIRCLVTPGDEVIIPEPAFVCYVPMVQMAGGTPVTIDLKEEDEFRLTAKQLREAITPKTKLLILPFPNNPTGGIMAKEDLEEIAEVLAETNIVVLSDELYAELTYGGEKHVSIANIPGMMERTVVINGLSKAYAMTGWRIGFACGPAPLIKQMIKVHQFGIMSAPTTAQYAAIEALRNGDSDIAMMKEEYDMRRRYIIDGFNKLGLTCFEPKGAFYVFPCIRSTGLTSEEFCTKLLEEQRVAVVPGNAFGASGEGFIRVSYAYSIKNIEKALERIERFMKK